MRSFGDYERIFSGLHRNSHVSYGVQQFFANGGSNAQVVRVPRTGAVPAVITLEDDVTGGANCALTVTDAATGLDAKNRLVDVDYDGLSDSTAFNLTITDLDSGVVETVSDVSMSSTGPRNVEAIVNDEATGPKLETVAIADPPAGRPVQTGAVDGNVTLSNLANDKDYSIRITSDVPTGAIADLHVPIFDTGEALPRSVFGVCRHVERKINKILGPLVPGAAVRCVPSDSGAGLRVIPDFLPELLNDAPDAGLSFGAGVSNGALTMIGLNAGTRSVGHYRLGLGRNIDAQRARSPRRWGRACRTPRG